jgi:inhibitor of KinA
LRVVPLGESAYLLRDLPAAPYRIARMLNLRPVTGLIEAVASYDSIGVYVEDGFDPRSLEDPPLGEEEAAKRHRIPVCYELGPDLAEAADRLRLMPEDVIEVHSQAVYRCAAVGFRPGFAYLGDLPDSLADLPRRAEPRLRVEAGSVGITGRQTGVYPAPSPGGWWLIGRTPFVLVDPETGYYPIEAGDEVVFVPIGRGEFEARVGERL